MPILKFGYFLSDLITDYFRFLTKVSFFNESIYLAFGLFFLKMASVGRDLCLKLTSKKTFKVVKYLLENFQTSQFVLSQKTGVAIGWVNEVVNFLSDLNIVSKGRRSCTLEDPVRLLEAIALERPLNRLVKSSFRLEVTSIREGEEILRRASHDRGIRYALTVFSGLRRFYEYHITYPSIHSYVSDVSVEKEVAHGEGPITLFLLSPDHPDILKTVRKVEEFSVCDPVQVAIDLFCSGVGRDAAVKFLEVLRRG